MFGARRAAAAILLALTCRCDSKSNLRDAASHGALGTANWSVTDLGIPNVAGLSGLTTDENGALWTIPERDRVLVKIVSEKVERQLPIDDFPGGLDAESLAWISGQRFAVGTEAKVSGRDNDYLLLIDIENDRARVVERIAIPYAQLPIPAVRNHGIEGLCHSDGHFLLALEEPLIEGDRRSAIVVHRLPDGRLRTMRLPLATRTGKISGLDCRRSGDVLSAVAIERHFGERHIVAFDVPLGAASSRLQSRLLRDLKTACGDDLNLEGIAWAGAALYLVVDNQYKVRTGPNELIRFVDPSGRSNSPAEPRGLTAREHSPR